MKTMRHLVIGLGLLCSVVACGGDDDDGSEGVTTTGPSATTSSPSTVAAATTTAGGTNSTTATTPEGPPDDVDPDGELIIGFIGQPATLDPARTTTVAVFAQELYDRLVGLDDALQPQPMLATGWEFLDASTLEMTLREDVTFEDGTAFDGEAVKVNIERSKTLPGSLRTQELSGVESVEVVSPYVVRFHLAHGGAALLETLAGPAGMMISPAVIASGASLDAGTQGGGSGPYVVEEFIAGDRVVYRQSPTVLEGRYWDRRAGLLKKLTWIYIPTADQQINAVRTGDIDIGQVTGTNTFNAKQLIDDGELDGRDVVLSTRTLSFYMRSTRPPFDNIQFRQALQFALDKEALSEGLYNGDCDVKYQFLDESHWAFSETANAMFSFDPDRARELLEESGLTDPSFTVQASAPYQAAAVAIQGMLAPYGIDMQIQNIETSDLSFERGEADALIGQAGEGLPDRVLNQVYLGPPYNLYDDADGSVTRRAQEAANPTLSQEEAAVLYDELFQLLTEQALIIPLCSTHQVWIQQADSTVDLANIRSLARVANLTVRYLYVAQP